MDDALEWLRTRRSIRKYENRRVEPETTDLLAEALLRSPTSRGFNHWEFLLVDEPGLLEGAPLGVVICGDESRTDVWIEDCAIAAAYVHATAHRLGLGSCWIQIRNRPHDEKTSADEYIRDLLKIPDPYRVECIVAVGHPAEKKDGVDAEALAWGKIRRNGW
ncbi:MAG: nitroreductase family protein [Planctomycetota bacterium]